MFLTYVVRVPPHHGDNSEGPTHFPGVPEAALSPLMRPTHEGDILESLKRWTVG